jgi:hypothetical protein
MNEGRRDACRGRGPFSQHSFLSAIDAGVDAQLELSWHVMPPSDEQPLIAQSRLITRNAQAIVSAP